MKQSRPSLALAVALVSITFALSPLLTDEFAGYHPDQFPVVIEIWPVQPAGWAFSIWGVIYLWLIVGAFWGVLKAPHDPSWQAMRRWLFVSLLIGTFWVSAANYSPLLATVLIFTMAVFAVLGMLSAGVENAKWQLRPVALYAGWLTAATGVGTGVVLGGYGLLSAQNAALAMLVLVLATAIIVQSLRPKEWAYPLAIIWALSGIIAANLATGNWPVISIAIIGIVALILGFFLRRHPRRTRFGTS